MSHTLIAPSSPPVAIISKVYELLIEARALTFFPLCPFNVSKGLLSSSPQILQVASSETDAIMSWVSTTAQTLDLCPYSSRVYTYCSSSTSVHTLNDLSSDTDIKLWPSRLNLTSKMTPVWPSNRC